MNEKFKHLGRALSKVEQKAISGGLAIVLCGGKGNFVERCRCMNSQGTVVGPCYCCHTDESQCITDNCGSGNQNWVCTH